MKDETTAAESSVNPALPSPTETNGRIKTGQELLDALHKNEDARALTIARTLVSMLETTKPIATPETEEAMFSRSTEQPRNLASYLGRASGSEKRATQPTDNRFGVKSLQ